MISRQNMSRRNTKEDIILATLELASENGLKSVSMQQIADKVGIRKASLYNHYSSKEEIITAMYGSIRRASKQRSEIPEVDYDSLADIGTLREVLIGAVQSYMRIVKDPQMNLFYKIIMNERSVDKIAAEIMVQETRAMIDSTAKLFAALQRKGKADFSDVNSAAFLFSMSVHSTIDYCFDLEQLEDHGYEDLMESMIDEFCRRYEPRCC